MLVFYKATSVPVLMYGSECLAMNKADRRAVEAAEMKFYDTLLGISTKTKCAVGTLERN
jgi:hypothetical protein